jgi:2-amino-4-hydroxy-6-hydroxymethyldihydropteridine diphosphokinase
MTTVYVGLGSNLDGPETQIRQAMTELQEIPGVEVTARSSLYISAPLGPQDQADFVNAVARLETTLPANILLDTLQAIETRHGRKRERHWGPRTLDLDILTYGDITIDLEQLTVPHSQLTSRAFVLYPMMEIDAGLEIPGHGRVSDLVLQLGDPEPHKAGRF